MTLFSAHPSNPPSNSKLPRITAALLLAVPLFISPPPVSFAATEVESNEPTAVDLLSLPEEQRAFFQDGPGLLVPTVERARTLALEDAARSEWMARFLADPDPSTLTNELTEGIARRKRLATADFASPLDVRWQLEFLNGKPTERIIIDCGLVFRPLELWEYDAPESVARAKDGKPLRGRVLVYQPSLGEPFRAWRKTDGKATIYTDDMLYWLKSWEEFGRPVPRVDLEICPQARRIDRATGISGLHNSGKYKWSEEREDGTVVHYAGTYSERPLPIGRATKGETLFEPPSELVEWARAAALTDVPPAPATLAATDIEIDFPRREGQRMVARMRLDVDRAGLTAVKDGEREVVKVLARASIETAGRVFDEQRARFRAPSQPPLPTLPIAIEQPLRPGSRYLIRVTLEDEGGGGSVEVARAITVPSEPAPSTREFAVAESEIIPAFKVASRDSLYLLPPSDEVTLGLWRADALVTGERIVKVIFLVDGQPQLVRTKPPYQAELRFSTIPKKQIVRAEGYDAAGKLVAADEFAINQPLGEFEVTILEPKIGQRTSGRITARAQVSTPDERRVESVEFRLGDEVIAKLEKEPWEAQVTVPTGNEIAYITVVATLDDGTTSEATRFLNAPENLSEVDVDLVELFAAVTDSSGLLIEGLVAADFTVRENDRPQAIQKFEPVDNLPLTVGLVLDTSGSMAGSLTEAQLAAVNFLERVLKPKDRAFAMAFAGRPTLLIPPTDDLGAVRLSLEGAQAIGGTALHDALVAGLYYFRGRSGQKAMILLSDGDDTASQIEWKDAFEVARRGGVAVYPIGFKVPFLTGVRNKLQDLAQATGGRVFFVDKEEELASAYAEIERELRNRYLIAYASDQLQKTPGFRKVDVEVKKRGAKVRTARGYYP